MGGLVELRETPLITLGYISPKDRRFQKWKLAGEKLAIELIGTDNKLSQKLGDCATWLLFKQKEDGLKLASSNFCKSKICPLCSWRKRLVWLQRLYTSLNTIKCLYRDSTPKKKLSLIFLTLSQRNCIIDDLGSEIKRMSKAWHEFIRDDEKSTFSPKIAPQEGYFRAMEVTVSLRNWRIYCNVHYHAILVAPQGYGKKENKDSFIPQHEWVKAWRRAMQLDYDPTAHVKFTSFKNQSEIVKYLVKPLNYNIGIERQLRMYEDRIREMTGLPHSDYYSVLVGLNEQLKHCQQFTTGGIIRRYMPRRLVDDMDTENLINIREAKEVIDTDPSTPNLLFRWNEGNYLLSTLE